MNLFFNMSISTKIISNKYCHIFYSEIILKRDFIMHGISYFLEFILNKKTDTSKKN